MRVYSDRAVRAACIIRALPRRGDRLSLTLCQVAAIGHLGLRCGEVRAMVEVRERGFPPAMNEVLFTMRTLRAGWRTLLAAKGGQRSLPNP